MEQSPRERIPETWIGERVNLEGAPHAQGVLRDVNEFGIAYEIAHESLETARIIFVPWSRIEMMHLLPPRS
jgi:hypothetical protein